MQKNGPTNNQPRWPWLLSIVAGFGVFSGVVSVVPGPRCADGTSSYAIGRRGACSHHNGVISGWGFLGVPAGLFAGMGTLAMIEALMTWSASRRHETSTRRAQVRRSRPPASATARPRRPREHLDEFLRRAILARQWVKFRYHEEGGTGQHERTVRPRWLQMSEVAGENTFCLVADCSVEGRRVFALSGMEQLQVLEPGSVA